MKTAQRKPGPAPGARYNPPRRVVVRINNAFSLWFRGATPPRVLAARIRTFGDPQ